MLIGKKMRELREAKKMSLSDLAQKSSVQIATLSRIENLKMTGTLESHLAIAKALGVELTQLYHDLAPAKPQEPKADNSAETFAYNEKASYEILAKNILNKRMMPVILRLEAGGATNPEENPDGSEKFVFVVEGKIEVHLAEKTYPLSSGQTLYFDASVKHYFRNAGAKRARLIAVVTPVAL